MRKLYFHRLINLYIHREITKQVSKLVLPRPTHKQKTEFIVGNLNHNNKNIYFYFSKRTFFIAYAIIFNYTRLKFNLRQFLVPHVFILICKDKNKPQLYTKLCFLKLIFFTEYSRLQTSKT